MTYQMSYNTHTYVHNRKYDSYVYIRFCLAPLDQDMIRRRTAVTAARQYYSAFVLLYFGFHPVILLLGAARRGIFHKPNRYMCCSVLRIIQGTCTSIKYGSPPSASSQWRRNCAWCVMSSCCDMVGTWLVLQVPGTLYFEVYSTAV